MARMKPYTGVFLSLKNRRLSPASSFISSGPAAVPCDVCELFSAFA